MRKDCFALKNRKSDAGNFKQHDENLKKASVLIGANTIGVEAGMFLRSDFLVDMGAMNASNM